jgi:nitrite reductase/ring-hydroxylating ferredoxin subunit
MAGCDDSVKSSIPDFPVSLELNLTSTYPTFKNSVNQFLIFKEPILVTDHVGYGGIIVCTGLSFDDSGNTQYFAFDMSCPYEALNSVRVYPDYTTFLPHVICEKCGSVFDVSFGYGNPISGPAKEYLKRYRTSLSGDVLYITR